MSEEALSSIDSSAGGRMSEIRSLSSSLDPKSWEVRTIIRAREGSRGSLTLISVKTRVVGSEGGVL